MVWFKSFTTSLVLAVAATSASAASYTFDLQKIGSYHGDGDAGVLTGNVLSVTETGDSGSLTATFTGKYIVDPTYSTDGVLSGTVNDAYSIERHHNGLGVCNVGSCASGADAFHTVDGASELNSDPITDFVEMAFFVGSDSVDVTLKSLTFGWIGDIYADLYVADHIYPGTNGLFEILVTDLLGVISGDDAVLAFSGLATATPGITGGLDAEILPGLAALTDNLFGIKASIGGSWKLMAATVDYTVPEIPLPAAGWLMLAGIGSVVALRRKKT
jgi:hypothetical protein